MKQFFSLLAAGLVGGALVLAGNFYFNNNATAETQTETTATFAKNVNASPSMSGVMFDFSEAAEKAMPAVVHISSIQNKVPTNNQQQGNPFQYFFGDDWWFGSPTPKAGTGSGVIYSPDGYIITNNHVVDFADEIKVVMNDNREFKAEVVGTYPKADLAVIKIDGQNLPTLKIADSDRAKVGQWVLAVGNPFDLTSTVTAGIISATGRDINIIQGNDAIESFIQTDAAVNPGNSGGALVDAQGSLLGINTAISTRTGVFEGYSFAIPINIATRIVDDIIKNGSYERPYLGVNISELDAEYANELGVGISQGVVVEALAKGGSAEYAGMLPKDIIIGVQGRSIKSVPELQEAIGGANVGDRLNVRVLRKGKEIEIPVTLKAG
jgi:Do/DeqQ family serine protease